MQSSNIWYCSTVKPRHNEIEGALRFGRYNGYFVIAIAGIYANIGLCTCPKQMSGKIALRRMAVQNKVTAFWR